MNFKLDIPLHHAYCLEGYSSSVKEGLFKFLEKEIGFKVKANPDLWVGDFDKFGIDESRMISEFQNNKALSGKKKFLIISANSLTLEAQNSLLKTFEEPTPNTHLFLILLSSEILLPTLKSRLVIQKVESDEKDLGLALNFLKLPQKERMDMAKEMAENQDRLGAIKLLNQLEKLTSEKIDIKKIKPEEIIFFETLNKFRSYLNDRSPSIKMIVEHIALITPQI